MPRDPAEFEPRFEALLIGPPNRINASQAGLHCWDGDSWSLSASTLPPRPGILQGPHADSCGSADGPAMSVKFSGVRRRIRSRCLPVGLRGETPVEAAVLAIDGVYRCVAVILLFCRVRNRVLHRPAQTPLDVAAKAPAAGALKKREISVAIPRDDAALTTSRTLT